MKRTIALVKWKRVHKRGVIVSRRVKATPERMKHKMQMLETEIRFYQNFACKHNTTIERLTQ